MPALVKQLNLTGLVDASFVADSLRDAAKREPADGVYTVSNTYNSTQTLLLDAHFDRLEDSARRECIALAIDRPRLRRALRQMIYDSGYGDVRFRISVPAAKPEEMMLSIEPFEPPAPDLLRSGVRCITIEKAKRLNPAAKSSRWIHQRELLLAGMPEGFYEAFLVDSDGGILEGLSSNFYAIKNGQLLTAGEGVLAGISRSIVFTISAGIISLRLQTPQRSDLLQFNEAFLTSSSRGIIPIVELDGKTVGNGKVGSETNRLRKAYDRWVKDHLEEL